jgi:hypothetical protein
LKNKLVEWVEAIVIKISVDKMYFDLQDPKTEKIQKRVWRGLIRKLGRLSIKNPLYLYHFRCISTYIFILVLISHLHH